MAPGSAHPVATPPPSKAGPAEQAHDSRHSLLPSTISPLVPMSMKRVSLSVARSRREHAGGDIAADVAADARQDVDTDERVGVEPHLAGHQVGRRQERGHVRVHPQILRVEPEQQVGHRRVAGDDDLVDLGELDAVRRQLLEEVVDGLDGESLQSLQALLARRVDDAADHVLAARDLLVVVAAAVDDTPLARSTRWTTTEVVPMSTAAPMLACLKAPG